MPVTSLQAAIGAAVVNVVSILVSFGILSSTLEGVVITACTSLITVAFLIANATHATAAARVKAASTTAAATLKAAGK